MREGEEETSREIWKRDSAAGEIEERDTRWRETVERRAAAEDSTRRRRRVVEVMGEI